MAERIPRGSKWGLGGFNIAKTLRTVSVTCHLHSSKGKRGNKNLDLGTIFSQEEATRRIKEWCVRGLDIPASPEGREVHMKGRGNPRHYTEVELHSEAEYDALYDQARPPL